MTQQILLQEIYLAVNRIDVLFNLRSDLANLMGDLCQKRDLCSHFCCIQTLLGIKGGECTFNKKVTNICEKETTVYWLLLVSSLDILMEGLVKIFKERFENSLFANPQQRKFKN